jgi:hypothetical protein
MQIVAEKRRFRAVRRWPLLLQMWRMAGVAEVRLFAANVSVLSARKIRLYQPCVVDAWLV